MTDQHSGFKEGRQVGHAETPEGAASGADLSAMIGSRICHDLISPLGAIANGVELLSMTGLSAAPEMALIAESIEAANARIRYYRIAFGAAGAEARVGRAELMSILEDQFRSSRVDVDWRVAGDPPRTEVKLALLLILCAEASMPWGGRIRVEENDGAYRLVGSADRLRPLEDEWAYFGGRDPAEPLGPSSVQFLLAPIAARVIGREVRRDTTRAGIVLNF